MASIGTRIEVTEEGTEQRPQYENLPNGNYLLQMESADVVEKNQGTSEQAQQIGNSQFQCLLRAIEIPSADDTDELLFRSFMATVGLGKDSKEKNADGTPVYPAKPEIKRYWYPDVGDAPAPGVTATPPSSKTEPARAPANDNRQAAAAASSAPKKATPWGKKAA